MVPPSTPPVRKTYPTRRQSAVRDAARNESSAEETDMSPRRGSPKKQVSPSKGSETKPKRVDVFLPPPSPKRSRFAAVGETVSEQNPKPVSKTSETPVQANKGNTPKKAPVTPTPALLTRTSLISFSKSKRAPSPPEDDSESVTESTTPGSARRTRTEEQRIQYLREQPDCGEFEPHRAFCKRCNRWVGMGGRTTYPIYKWTKHIEKCRIKGGGPAESDGGESGDDQASTVGTPDRTPRRNEEQRRQFLQNDPRTLILRDGEVQCRACQKWIKLGAQRRYDLSAWNQHCGRCTGELPSGRTAVMSRRNQLVNDPQVKSFTTEAVVCNACDLPVVLQGDGDYNLVAWEEHKLGCIPPKAPVPIPPPSVVAEPPKPPVSNADTEATLVGTSSSPSRGKKRQREDGENVQEPINAAAEDLDARPTTKRRTESYEPPAGFLPSLWKWATTEVRAFVRAAFGGGGETKEEPMEDSPAAANA